MVDPDRRPDPRSLWTRILDGVFARRSRVEEATDASHDIAVATTANYLVRGETARLIGGPRDGQTVTLTHAPPVLVIAGRAYDRIDDPDTGDYLGGYAFRYKETT